MLTRFAIFYIPHLKGLTPIILVVVQGYVEVLILVGSVYLPTSSASKYGLFLYSSCTFSMVSLAGAWARIQAIFKSRESVKYKPIPWIPYVILWCTSRPWTTDGWSDPSWSSWSFRILSIYPLSSFSCDVWRSPVGFADILEDSFPSGLCTS